MTATSPTVLTGAKTRLRPIEEGDNALLVCWYNDPEVRHWLHLSEAPEETLESQRERLQRFQSDPARRNWIIETLAGEPVGNVSLIGIDEAHGRAELGVSIGAKAFWGRGLGTDAIRRVLRHAFAELALRRVWLITDADNQRAIRCYEKCGFVREGVLRSHRLRYGQPLDMVVMGALAEEWRREASQSLEE